MKEKILALCMVGCALFLISANADAQPTATKITETTKTSTNNANHSSTGERAIGHASPIKRMDSPSQWAFTETFDGDPPSPSQALLPRNIDYVVTHRTHPADHFGTFKAYPADHSADCAGPDPAIVPLPEHAVVTSHRSNGHHPDQSFFICKNHMMSSMGDVEGYSVTSFWPKQEFDFASGGVLEFDVNINDDHPRSWWEVLITPRAQLKVAAADEWLPIDETYPADRIVFKFMDSKRSVEVGAGAVDPDGVMVEESDSFAWADMYPADPANTDRRIRRSMRIALQADQIVWSIQRDDGSFDDYAVDIAGGVPFTRGLVVFKTHAYTPQKDGNTNNYTFHWDTIRFSGPVVGRYETIEADEVVYLQANGSRNIGESETVSIALPHVGLNPTLFGQVHNPMRGQVLLSINDQPNRVVHPYQYTDADCVSTGWKSFRVALEPEWLSEGTNTFTWTIGPRPDCVDDWVWDGFSIKDLEIQFDLPAETGERNHRLFLPLIY